MWILEWLRDEWAKGPPEWPCSLDWLRDAVENRCVGPAGEWCVLALAERDWVGSPEFCRDVERLIKRGVLGPGTLDAILEARPRP